MNELVAIAWATGATYGELIGDSPVGSRLQFAGRVESPQAADAMKQEAVFFMEVADHLDSLGVVAG